LKITVTYLGHVKKLLDTESPEQIQLPKNASINDLLLKLTKKHGAPFKNAVFEPGEPDVKPNMILTVNGLLLNQLNGTNTQLKNSDNVAIMPIVSGG
jgi:molybdopterin converting factor small subunit